MRLFQLDLKPLTGETSDDVCEPLESLAHPHFLDHAHHEHLEWSSATVLQLYGAGSQAHGQLQSHAQLIFRSCHGDVDLVSQNHDRNAFQVSVSKQLVQLLPGLLKPRPVCSVHNEDDCIELSKVVLPNPSHCFMATDVVGPENHVLDLELLHGGKECRLQRLQAAVS